MIFSRKDFFTLSYYKKQPYTASSGGTRVRLVKAEDKEKYKDGEEEKEKVVRTYFSLCLYPEPFSYQKTPDDQKTFYEFEFSEEGILAIIDFLNEKIGVEL